MSEKKQMLRGRRRSEYCIRGETTKGKGKAHLERRFELLLLLLWFSILKMRKEEKKREEKRKKEARKCPSICHSISMTFAAASLLLLLLLQHTTRFISWTGEEGEEEWRESKKRFSRLWRGIEWNWQYYYCCCITTNTGGKVVRELIRRRRRRRRSGNETKFALHEMKQRDR